MIATLTRRINTAGIVALFVFGFVRIAAAAEPPSIDCDPATGGPDQAVTCILTNEDGSTADSLDLLRVPHGNNTPESFIGGCAAVGSGLTCEVHDTPNASVDYFGEITLGTETADSGIVAYIDDPGQPIIDEASFDDLIASLAHEAREIMLPLFGLALIVGLALALMDRAQRGIIKTIRRDDETDQD